MYEENTVPAWRKIVILAVAGVAIVAIVWLTVWLIFFHNHSTTPASSKKPSSSSSQGSRASSDSESRSSSSSTSSTTPPSSSPSTSSASTSTPTLANTGPGNVFAPVVFASLTGSALYYIRLRRKLTE
jgi:cytoskeletal protein RodZ